MSKSKARGTSFEKLIADGLREALDDDRIERRALSGVNDRGDIAGVRLHGQRVVIEAKNIATGKVFHLPEWVDEAQREARNDDALVGVVAHKRQGTQDWRKQWISMTVEDFCAVLTGQRLDQ